MPSFYPTYTQPSLPAIFVIGFGDDFGGSFGGQSAPPDDPLRAFTGVVRAGPNMTGRLLASPLLAGVVVSTPLLSGKTVVYPYP